MLENNSTHNPALAFSVCLVHYHFVEFCELFASEIDTYVEKGSTTVKPYAHGVHSGSLPGLLKHPRFNIP